MQIDRGALISQNQPELSYEAFRKRIDVNKGVDAQPTIKEKKKYAATHSPYRTDLRDVYTVSYVGQVLKEEGISYRVSDIQTRYLPRVQFHE